MGYLTEKGMEDLVKKLKFLRDVERKQELERLDEARKHGDLRENGDYKASRENLSRLDAKIMSLEIEIANSEIIEDSKEVSDTVKIFSEIKIKDHTRDRIISYTIVTDDQADPMEKKISSGTPIAKALLGKRAGDKFMVHLPIGDVEFEILSIK